MKVDNSIVEEIAHLARLKLTEEEKTHMISEMSEILNWMEKLNEVDTSNVEPLVHMSQEMNVLRDDIEGEMLSHDAALKNAPKSDSSYFRVPKVIE